jgi:hypothetical protein
MKLHLQEKKIPEICKEEMAYGDLVIMQKKEG